MSEGKYKTTAIEWEYDEARKVWMMTCHICLNVEFDEERLRAASASMRQAIWDDVVHHWRETAEPFAQMVIEDFPGPGDGEVLQ